MKRAFSAACPTDRNTGKTKRSKDTFFQTYYIAKSAPPPGEREAVRFLTGRGKAAPHGWKRTAGHAKKLSNQTRISAIFVLKLFINCAKMMARENADEKRWILAEKYDGKRVKPMGR